MKGMLDPEYEERVTGHAEVRQTFKASGVGIIAGSYVLDGKIVRDCKVRITREGEQICFFSCLPPYFQLLVMKKPAGGTLQDSLHLLNGYDQVRGTSTMM